MRKEEDERMRPPIEIWRKWPNDSVTRLDDFWKFSETIFLLNGGINVQWLFGQFWKPSLYK